MRHGVSCEIKVYWEDNCDGEFDSRQSLVDHQRKRGGKEAMHRYTLEFMEEWNKQK
jgi:hypothetical protein